MTPRSVATPLVFAGLTAVLLAALRPICLPEEGFTSSTQTHAREATQPADKASRVEPLHFTMDAAPYVLSIRRNVFSYVQVSAPRLTLPPTPLVQRTPAPLPQATTVPAQARAPEPDFPYKYIGRFGPEQSPIAVFAGNGDVVNAQIGDWLAGQFRLSAVGLESVEIVSATGSVHRVSLQP